MKELNDYELLEYINEKNEIASNLMFDKYKPLIISLAKKYSSFSTNYGLDINDLIQEGMLGLHQAIINYNSTLDNKFSTFAKICIERKIISNIIKAKRNKNKILNESFSLGSDLEETSLENFIGDYDSNPENIVINIEEEKELLEKLYKSLSPYEEQVFELKKSGFSYKEIADILDKKPKNIDNTIQRIRMKLRNIINETNK